jgi:hypothetical protein
MPHQQYIAVLLGIETQIMKIWGQLQLQFSLRQMILAHRPKKAWAIAPILSV